jgi:hypothetical protein
MAGMIFGTAADLAPMHWRCTPPLASGARDGEGCAYSQKNLGETRVAGSIAPRRTAGRGTSVTPTSDELEEFL